MLKRRIVITIAVLLIFASLSTAVYFAFFKPNSDIIKAQGKNNEEIKNQSIETMNIPKIDMITSKTKVKIIYNYLINNDYTIEREEYNNKIINSIIGLNEEQVRKYFDKMNYRLLSFSPDEIKVETEIINSWPPNCFVVKANVDEIVIYTVDSQGVLTLPQKTGLYIDMLPAEDREAVMKGKVYYKYEDVEELLGDYKS